MGSTEQAGLQAPEEVAYASVVNSWTSEERAERERKFVRKIDVRLLPILMVMYVMNYIDRNALPQARVQGLEEDLNLSGYEYNIVLSLTFIGYILMQVPSNMLLSLTRPSIYLSCCMIAWGVASGATGAVHNFSGLAACRFILGVTEAPFFAGCAFLFSGWYTRKELGLRLAIFYCAAMLAGAFGGLFAAGIEAAFKNHSLPSWRWLFIIEGAATVLFAVLTGFIIPDWPATTKWLSPEERAIGIIRLVEDAGDEDESTPTLDACKLAVKNPYIWLCVLGQVCLQAVASLTNFLPTLVQTFGFGTIETLLLTAPPYVLTAAVCLLNSWLSDRTSARSPSILIPSAVACTGIIITVATTNTAARYLAIFLMLPGTYGCMQISNAWMANIAARPQKMRAIGLAMNNSIGNSALVWTPYLYPESQGPRYVTAWAVNLSLMVVGMASTVWLRVLLARENRAMMRAEEEQAHGEPVSDGDEDAKGLDRAYSVARARDGGLRARYQI
ncbi:major facilitator superfamily domain-containing protein [Aspergillus pseudoustus]|uniref:Major facilitator superfamily domain-containing protein n=1 Tax=Aspergillus pseudoustus TaxID=1810923 RepID=A0ABR4JRA8_9EURO